MRNLALLLVLSLVAACNGIKPDCEYPLAPAVGQPGTAQAKIWRDKLEVEFRRVNSETLYTVWIDHRSRATGAVSPDYPLAEGALPRGVAPSFATTAPVYAGMRLDLNGVYTDTRGNGKVSVKLDYNLLLPGATPVVGAGLSMQGKNRTGGAWLRTYPEDPSVQASVQSVDPVSGAPILLRSTAQGLTIVRHPDLTTHGHTPGTGGVDHFGAFSGDFPAGCKVGS